VREISDYEIFNEEMFTFVKERYGVDQIVKRYYIKGNYVYSSSLETRFKMVPIHVVRSDVLRSGKHQPFESK